MDTWWPCKQGLACDVFLKTPSRSLEEQPRTFEAQQPEAFSFTRLYPTSADDSTGAQQLPSAAAAGHPTPALHNGSRTPPWGRPQHLPALTFFSASGHSCTVSSQPRPALTFFSTSGHSRASSPASSTRSSHAAATPSHSPASQRLSSPSSSPARATDAGQQTNNPVKARGALVCCRSGDQFRITRASAEASPKDRDQRTPTLAFRHPTSGANGMHQHRALPLPIAARAGFQQQAEDSLLGQAASGQLLGYSRALKPSDNIATALETLKRWKKVYNLQCDPTQPLAAQDTAGERRLRPDSARETGEEADDEDGGPSSPPPTPPAIIAWTGPSQLLRRRIVAAAAPPLRPLPRNRNSLPSRLGRPVPAAVGSTDMPAVKLDDADRTAASSRAECQRDDSAREGQDISMACTDATAPNDSGRGLFYTTPSSPLEQLQQLQHHQWQSASAPQVQSRFSLSLPRAELQHKGMPDESSHQGTAATPQPAES